MTEIIVRDSTDVAEYKPISMEDGLAADAAHRTLMVLDAKRMDDYTDEDKQTITRAGDYVSRVFEPACPAECLVALRYLKAFKPRRNTETAEYATVAEALANDLSKYPLWAVQLGCERYRVKADKTFFPDAAEEIISLARPELRRWASAKDIADRLKSSMEWTPAAELKEETGE